MIKTGMFFGYDTPVIGFSIPVHLHICLNSFLVFQQWRHEHYADNIDLGGKEKKKTPMQSECQAENNQTKNKWCCASNNHKVDQPIVTRYCKTSTETFIIAASSWHK